jgi:hypothetical protein
VASNSAEPRVRVTPEARPLAVGVCVFLLVFVVALGSSRSLDRVGGPANVLSGRSIAGDVGVLLAVFSVFVLAAIVSVFWGGGRWRRKKRDEPECGREEPEMPWREKPLLLAIAFLPAAGLIAAIVLIVRRCPGGALVTARGARARDCRRGAAKMVDVVS